ncbi:conjugal transfer protein TraX [Erwinia amylovora]|uniref:conjugal transfer protein TraX n=2 Tax=Erwinia amylovora TaxID=552 RepID=UPI0001CCBA35|nr:conjugal transfer protein TraX [Erwinia amylovora]CBJ48278.1 conjugal transfer protein [Erwinia amylovora ATCC 49946]
MKRADTEAPATNEKKATITPKRLGWFVMNVFVPAAEITGVVRYTGRSVSRIWQRIRDVTAGRNAHGYCPADWSQAVSDSGLSPARLARNFRITRWLWWGLMWLTGLPALGCLALLIAAGGNVSGTGWLRIGCVLLVMSLLTATGFVQVLVASYRLWQLTEKRVSASEEGSFQAFLHETHWCRTVLSSGLVNRKKIA